MVEEHTEGLGVDISVICVGKPDLVNTALGATRQGGRVNVFAGLAGAGWSEIEANLIHYNELTITGASDSRRRDYDTALRMIESGSIDAERMVTHCLLLRDAERAIEISARGEGMKLAVMPQLETRR